MPTKEKRESKRIQQPFAMRVSTGTGRSPLEWSMVTTHDLSGKGAFFTMDQKVSIGDKLSIRIHFVDHLVSCKAEVLRVAKGFHEPLLDVAVAFTDLNKVDRERIEAYEAN